MGRRLHSFESGGKRFVMDVETCFCFECDAITSDVLAHYPEEPVNRICRLLEDRHPRAETAEVIGELEWLRVTRAILSRPKTEDLLQRFDAACLRHMAVDAAPGAGGVAERIAAAGRALLAGSGAVEEAGLRLRFPAPPETGVAAIAEALRGTIAAARFSAKSLRIEIEMPVTPRRVRRELEGHRLSCRVALRPEADVEGTIAALFARCDGRLESLHKAWRGLENVAETTLLARPGHANFGGLGRFLREMGYRRVALDIPGAYAVAPQLYPAEVTAALAQSASDYATCVLRGEAFHLEPIASLFAGIYTGTPCLRADAAGVESLFVDVRGDLYPDDAFAERGECRLGTLASGRLDPDLRGRLREACALTRAVCQECWARYACGGGHAVIHQARTGSFTAPDPRWCDAQRSWIEQGIVLFHPVSASGFSPAVDAFAKSGPSLSWWQAIRAAVKMRLGARAIRESDAVWLTAWEDWNTASYFLFNETGAMLATRYDREMDALHPRGVAREMVLTRRNGTPCGLLRLRPDRSGVIWVALYLHDEKEYADKGVRDSLRLLLGEFMKQPPSRCILAPAASHEPALAACLEAIGFRRAGMLREALYLHGAYKDIAVFSAVSR